MCLGIFWVYRTWRIVDVRLFFFLRWFWIWIIRVTFSFRLRNYLEILCGAGGARTRELNGYSLICAGVCV